MRCMLEIGTAFVRRDWMKWSVSVLLMIIIVLYFDFEMY